MSKDSRDLVTRRNALGLMGIGAVGVVSETLGFTNVTAGRGVDIGVSDDQDSILGIEADDSGGATTLDDDPFDSPLTITFSNQSSSDDVDLDVTISETSGDTSLTVDATDFGDADSENIAAGGDQTFSEKVSESADLEITVDDDNETATIDVAPVEADFGGTTLELTRENIDIEGDEV